MLLSWTFQDSLVASAIFNGVKSRQEEAQMATRDSSVPGRPPDPAEELCDGRVAVLSVGEHVPQPPQDALSAPSSGGYCRACLSAAVL